ncbi:alpha-protein kinase 1 [Rhinophrynus dorsalis]
MNNQEVVAVLQECKQMLDSLASEVSDLSEEEKNDYQRREASLPDDLRTLIQDAKEMKWPFVPERWQYKQAVGPEDKTNLQDMINPRLHDLLVFLKASIMVRDSAVAAAIVFLVDRFLYWADASTRLLQVAKSLHKTWPSTPIAPQVVIRQARVSANSGKLLKAEYILSSLINNNGATGSWIYSEESDRILVQSVCIQIRGQILQKLGMWYEAAELIWASIVGFSELPIPDKKGIATSLGILADIFISMSKEDYQRFKMSNHVRLSILEEFDHQLLSAAEACKLAATFSLYTPLFVLTNLNIRGTCLLSYSFSNDCPVGQRPHYLNEAKEAFEIGLLTKKQGDSVTSKQELHSFVKSASGLTNVHKWLQNENAHDKDVSQLCREAMEKLSTYTLLADKQDKGSLAKEIMLLVGSVKEYLNVQPFPNSDERSYVPENYKDCLKKPLINGNISFKEVLDMYSHHHNSVCEVFESTCRNWKTMEVERKSGACVTALKTLDTVSATEDLCHEIAGDCDPLHLKSVQKRTRLVRSNAMNISLEDDSKKIRSFNSSHSSSSFKSWCNVSNSSSSWEAVNFNNENELPNECNIDGNKMDSPCSTAESDGVGENSPQENNHSAKISFQDLSIQEEQEGSDDYPQHSFSIKNSDVDPHSVSETHPSSVIIEAAENRYTEASQTHGSVVSSESTAIGYGQSADIEPFEIVDFLAETESATDVSKTYVTKNEQTFKGDISRLMLYNGIDPEGETKDTTDDVPTGFHEYTANVSPGSSKIQNLVSYKRFDSSSEGRSIDVDQAADTEILKQQWSTDSSSSKSSLQQQNSTSSVNYPVSPSKEIALTLSTDKSCDSTDVDYSPILSSSHGSSSWNKSIQFSSSLSESFSVLNSSGSSFGLSHAKNTEQIEARSLDIIEYKKLLSGVDHDWLLKRLENTGEFRFTHFHKAYNALLLKFSKKSELWTAQETFVHFGDNVAVTKQGKQRNAFWIHFLHQDEALGRYVGKEYKDPKKNILYHFSDVERQMTAQYYVTEFNKRLYELNIPTQIFYIPSSVLLIVEDMSIKGCVSVEPYILGDFVKLSNNTKAVKTEYEATKYGLAFGHFTYEFSGYSDIVVDLQGWVTGSKKGEALIYLTDPQIHSTKNTSSEKSNKKGATCTNFGNKGIYLFFSVQHKECNEICHSLSLKRPDLKSLKKYI